MRPTKPHPHAEAVRAYRPLAALVPEHWRAHTVAAPDGANLRVTDTGGEGPAVLLLHGVQVNGLSWLRTARALEAEYRLFMPDWRGHGESARVGDANLDAASLIADARAIVAHFGLDDGPCHLVGHSMGADLAGRLSAEVPFASCALVDPALRDYGAATLQPNEEPLPWMAAIFATLAALPLLSHEERLQRALALLPPGTPLYEEADYVAFVSGQAQFDPAFYGQIARLGYLFQEPAVIARIACPLLLLTARPMMPGASLEPGLSAFTTHWQRGEHRHFPHCGHAIMFEALEEFVAELRRFWGTYRTFSSVNIFLC